MKEKNQDRIALDIQRRKAAEYMVQNYSREERYLIVFSRDFSRYENAFTSDNFKTNEKREGLRWDFYFDFISLKAKMKEYRWSKDFLAERGINFTLLKRLFYSLFTAEEIAAA